MGNTLKDLKLGYGDKVNQPDFWVVLKFPRVEPTSYRVLVAWSGGYIHGNSWRLSSGVTGVLKDGDNYNFENVSGSCYKCHKDAYGLHFGSLPTYESLVVSSGVEMLDEDTDWIGVDWNV